MFLLFSVSGAATSLFDEKKAGLFQRLLAAPVKRSHILWSKYLFCTTLGLVQLTSLFFAGRLHGMHRVRHAPRVDRAFAGRGEWDGDVSNPNHERAGRSLVPHQLDARIYSIAQSPDPRLLVDGRFSAGPLGRLHDRRTSSLCGRTLRHRRRRQHDQRVAVQSRTTLRVGEPRVPPPGLLPRLREADPRDKRLPRKGCPFPGLGRP